MTLYSSVYWTKRVLVVIALIVFICGGIRIFQFISSSLTKSDIQVSEFKPEFGFGKIDKMQITGLDTPDDFKPNFRITTTKGNLDADNGYPLESTQSPIANVYKITEQEISLETSRNPIRIATKIGLKTASNPKVVNSTTFSWNEAGKTLQIDGLYNLVDYNNNLLRQSGSSVEGSINKTDQAVLKSLFVNSLRDFDISFPDQDDYIYDAEYTIYDAKTDQFIPSGSQTAGSNIRINARRKYPNLVKNNSTAQARAIYPGGTISNNSVIVPANVNSDKSLLGQIAELHLYDWPVNQTIDAQNPNVQTYSIKTPLQAYTELQNGTALLVSAYKSDTRQFIDTSTLSGIDVADVLSIRIDEFEQKTYRKYIQPTYVFTVEVSKDNERILLIYNVPAVVESQILQ